MSTFWSSCKIINIHPTRIAILTKVMRCLVLSTIEKFYCISRNKAQYTLKIPLTVWSWWNLLEYINQVWVIWNQNFEPGPGNKSTVSFDSLLQFVKFHLYICSPYDTQYVWVLHWEKSIRTSVHTLTVEVANVWCVQLALLQKKRTTCFYMHTNVTICVSAVKLLLINSKCNSVECNCDPSYTY